MNLVPYCGTLRYGRPPQTEVKITSRRYCSRLAVYLEVLPSFFLLESSSGSDMHPRYSVDRRLIHVARIMSCCYIDGYGILVCGKV